MLQALIRALKRLAILVPGLIIAYLSIFNIYPRLNNELPFVIAIIITYLLGAYVLIPLVIRAVRVFIRADHLPFYCITPDGFASDPLNIGLIGTREELIAAMTAAGWHKADDHSLRNTIHEGLSVVYNWSYPNAPVSSLYLFGRKQDVAFNIPLPDAPAGSRHHVRFWATSYENGNDLSVHTIDWRHRAEHVSNDRLLWVGAASRDVGVTFIRHNMQITHMIDPDTDGERELIMQQLKDTKRATFKQNVKLGDPYKLTNRVWRGFLQTDGQMSVMELKPVQTKPKKAVRSSDS